MTNKRNIREEMKTVSGGQFKKWYNSLTKEEKIEYNFILQNLKNPTPPKEEIIEVDLGEAINFWISKNGSLNLDTTEDEIINFYLKNKQ
jgi:hypothetical protein